MEDKTLMATVENRSTKREVPLGGNWKVSSKAVELLQCFMNGIDDVIIRMALDIAQRKRKPGSLGDIRVDADDIEQAANDVLSRIRTQELPADLKSEISEMEECLKAKCSAMK